jgi:hypothetical protein
MGSITLVIDNGAPKQLTSLCDTTWNPSSATSPIGYVFAAPVPPTQELRIQGCAMAAANSEGLHIALTSASGPGTYTAGLVRYTDTVGSPWGWPNDPFSVKITTYDMTGGIIEGTFTATVSHIMNGNAAHTLQGSFHVCHVQDELAP